MSAKTTHYSVQTQIISPSHPHSLDRVIPAQTCPSTVYPSSSGSLAYSASPSVVCQRSIYLVQPHTKLSRDDEGAQASRAQHDATSQRQYLTEHIRFITHQGKQILLLDVSNCSAAEVGKIFRAVPEVVTTRPCGSVLILSDFTGASFDQEAMRVMKETAVFDKPFVKKSAWTGAESFPRAFSENLSSFARREFPVFETREKALAWLAKD